MSEYRGPRINHIEKTITRRDSLGIEGIANTISAELCPIVNTVTPRPFYWALINWGYWKQYQLTKKEDDVEARKLIKRVNYFLAIASYLANTVQSENNFIGLSVIQSRYWEKTEEYYTYDPKYITNSTGSEEYLSTMAYYPPGVESLYLAVLKDNDGNEYSQHHLTPKGECMALAFEEVMQQTEYGRNCIEDNCVSKDVLIELGHLVDIRLTHFDKCKLLLKEYLFADGFLYSKLLKSKDYLQYVIKMFHLSDLTLSICRSRFFDAFSPRGESNDIPSDLLSQAKGWEIAIGRQYFTTGLSIIWTYMQEQLSRPMYQDEWIVECLKSGMESISIDEDLGSIISKYKYNSGQLEEIAKKARMKEDPCKLEYGFIMLLAVYNRFNEREDFDQKEQYYLNLGDRVNISLSEFISLVNAYNNRPIRDILTFIMDQYLIKQHLQTAFNKMLQGRDGYFIAEIEGRFQVKEEFYWEFQGNRMVQLFSVMKDLEVLP